MDAAIALTWIITMYGVGCDVKPNHPTKAGTQPVVGFTAAADPAVLPIGSLVEIEGIGQRMIHDIGGKVKGLHIDVFVATCREAKTSYRRVRVLHVPKRKTSS
jgi:3D (Asp-Asp-Asp) domain-containing protein